MISLSNHFGFDFTTLICKPLYKLNIKLKKILTGDSVDDKWSFLPF